MQLTTVTNGNILKQVQSNRTTVINAVRNNTKFGFTGHGVAILKELVFTLSFEMR